MIDMFKNKRKSKDNLMCLLSSFHDEMHGDRLQSHHLINSYYRINLQENTPTIKDMKRLINTYEPTALHGNVFNNAMQTIDNMFKDAINKWFYTFTAINTPFTLVTEVKKTHRCLPRFTAKPLSHNENDVFLSKKRKSY